jgi:hypothetical protein
MDDRAMVRARPIPALVALVAGALALGGCNSPDKVAETTAVCLSPDEVAFRVPKNAKLAPGVDYAEMLRQRLEMDTEKPENAYAVKAYGAFTLGERCKSAKDSAKCMQALASTPTRIQGAWQGALAGGSNDALLIRVTRAEGVSSIVIADDAKTIFLPVDTAEEAAMVALGRATPQQPMERTVPCNGPNVERRGDGSYVVTAEATRCEANGTAKIAQRVRVARDGKVTLIDEKSVNVTPGPCTASAASAAGSDAGKAAPGAH